MTVGEAIAGSLATFILQQITNLIEYYDAVSRDLTSGLRKLKTSFIHVQHVLVDLENLPTAGRGHIQPHLRELRDLAYDVNDLLDEIKTEGLRRGSQKEFVGTWLIPGVPSFQSKVAERISKNNEKIEDLIRNNSIRPPGQAPAGDRSHGSDMPTTGLLPGDPVIGRHSEAQQIVEALTIAGSTESLSVISILGIGGIGKTALAQVVFNDADVKEHFGDRRMWVYAPPGSSDVTNLTKLILESATGKPAGLSDLDNLQKSLRKLLRNKRYLLVLDNLWNEGSKENHRVSIDWSNLQKPLVCGAIGSRILITTRNPTTAKNAATNTPTEQVPLVLHGLCKEDCWSVFAHHAFGGSAGATGSDDDSEAKVQLGKKIAEGCCGSPLAARALGSHLQGADKHVFEKVWGQVSDGKMLSLDECRDGISLVLESTFHQLHQHLKQCLKFCSAFPNGFKFERDVLIRMWMAQGYLGQVSSEELENIGANLFDSLLEHNMFMPDIDDPSRYTMCGLIPEVGRYASDGECRIFQLHRDPNNIDGETAVRHCALVCDCSCQELPAPDQSKWQTSALSLCGTKGLYTLLLVIGNNSRCRISPHNPVKMAGGLTSLRVLDLGNSNIKSLDGYNIEVLLHLRYLGLSSTRIKELPESVCTLPNLQTLALRNCTSLKRLPTNMKKMLSLRHLDLHDDDDFRMETASCALRSMPKDVGKLQEIRTLSKFVVSKKKWARCGMTELGTLNNIQGDLRLLKLHNVQSEEEASKAKLACRTGLTRVELRWGDATLEQDDTSSDKREMTVLQNLKLHKNVKELWVVGYRGPSFPQWIGDASYSSLVKVRLSNCRNCQRLPPLGQLPLLEDLYIKGMEKVEYIDCARFCGCEQGARFRSLKVLRFEDMRNWKGWYGEKNCELPALRELVIAGCTNLHSICHQYPADATCSLT